MKWKVSRRTSFFLSAEGFPAFETTFEPSESHEPLVEKLPDGTFVVGYLVHDDDPENPFDSQEGLGVFLDRRDRKSAKAYEEIMAGHRDEDYEEGGKFVPLEEPYSLGVYCDVYPHGGGYWAVSGSIEAARMPGRPWDVSSRAGFWYPDEACLESIKASAIAKLLPKGVKVSYEDSLVFGPNTITLAFPNGNVLAGYFKSFLAAYQYAAKLLGVWCSLDEIGKAEKAVALGCATQAIEKFNRYLSGDAWGICVEHFDGVGEPLEEPQCWGYLGSGCAQKELASLFKACVERLSGPSEVQKAIEASASKEAPSL